MTTTMMSKVELEILPVVRRRVKALKNIQIQEMRLNGQLERERLKILINKFGHKFEELRSKRRDIIDGNFEPNKDECHHEFEIYDDSDEENENSADDESEDSNEADKKAHLRVAGVPKFWLTAMTNCGWVSDFITEEDEEVLEHLTDIVVKESDVCDETFKLTLEFHFTDNEFFGNRVLTKEYVLKFGVDPKDPWRSSPPYYAISVKGCDINWKKGKRLTHKSKDGTWNSFFQFFTPPEQPKDKEEAEDSALLERIEDDWNLVGYLTKKLVPFAVLYYTGDMADDADDESYESTDSQYSDSF